MEPLPLVGNYVPDDTDGLAHSLAVAVLSSDRAEGRRLHRRAPGHRRHAEAARRAAHRHASLRPRRPQRHAGRPARLPKRGGRTAAAQRPGPGPAGPNPAGGRRRSPPTRRRAPSRRTDAAYRAYGQCLLRGAGALRLQQMSCSPFACFVRSSPSPSRSTRTTNSPRRSARPSPTGSASSRRSRTHPRRRCSWNGSIRRRCAGSAPSGIGTCATHEKRSRRNDAPLAVALSERALRYAPEDREAIGLLREAEERRAIWSGNQARNLEATDTDSTLQRKLAVALLLPDGPVEEMATALLEEYPEGALADEAAFALATATGEAGHEDPDVGAAGGDRRARLPSDRTWRAMPRRRYPAPSRTPTGPTGRREARRAGPCCAGSSSGPWREELATGTWRDPWSGPSRFPR